MKFTRKDYMNGDCTHQEYYSQFVNDNILDYVKLFLNANPTPELKDWDRLHIRMFLDLELWRELQCPQFIGTDRYTFSLSDNVCIAKAAARILGKDVL